ncbi:MAG: mannose-1-phosphate guanylyltransferase [Candidatus Tokpelaia sp.]|nr:MAG: mannose-1-phosphate guanylyltransferase [Candidatus Tokpelaia sp.]KAA6205353.1 MAG: mannose-1-phosphate guanylyltransferase [Candidatus Tokpelaia sp.]
MTEKSGNPIAKKTKPARAEVPLVSFIMSGGVGTRLWPLSRQDFPKQFHDFSGNGSMLARTVHRLNFINRLRPENSAKMPVYLIASESHAPLLDKEISGLPLYGGQPVFEPLGRNTAAAVALACAISLQNYGDSLVLIVPSDHDIETEEQFWQTIEAGIPAAQDGKIVIFGIKPDRPETGYGYIEIAAKTGGKEQVFDVLQFKEKPDSTTAERYCRAGNFLWNSGIFLFSAKIMQQAFARFAPEIKQNVSAALAQARRDFSGLWLPFDAYKAVPADSVDYAIMEQADNIVLVPARFRWNDLGSWQSLLDTPAGKKNRDTNGNVIIGDVVAIDCERSYLRSQSGLLSAVGLKNMAVVATGDATFIAPVSQSQNVRKIVTSLENSGRLETRFTPAPGRPPVAGAHLSRVENWLFEEALPLWSTKGVDDKGGFHEVLNFDGLPLHRDKRMRTQARQVYTFAVAGARGWQGPYRELIAHGLDFIEKGRLDNGGFVATFDADGHIKDTTEDFYDQSFVLLALAHAHAGGERRARRLAEESFAFLDRYLLDKSGKPAGTRGYFETRQNDRPLRRANPHMHFLETCLAWYEVTGEADYLDRAANIVDLFRNIFFDADNWALGEFFDADWQRAKGEAGDICEPGHHFEWASLLVAYERHKTAFAARQANDKTADNAPRNIVLLARKLYASATASGVNRTTGLAYNSVSRFGTPIDCATRSWPQTEAIKAAIALDSNHGPDLKPEVESRIARLFRWHIDTAPKGLWIDAIDEQGKARSQSVPASIFYHLVAALTYYMDFAAALES